MRSAPESRTIALRGYSKRAKSRQEPPDKSDSRSGHVSPLPPFRWTVIFDTETTTDMSQAPRFGTYLVFKRKKLHDRGIFYNPDVITKSDLRTLMRYAVKHSLTLLTLEEFVDTVFYKNGYDYNGTIVGFNLPFDISRLAIHWAESSKKERGWWSLQLSQKKYFPRVQMKSLSGKASIIQFTRMGSREATEAMRKKKLQVSAYKGTFVDVATLAHALYSTVYSLESLTEALDTPHKKSKSDEHGKRLTHRYLDYAMSDVWATWDCYLELKRRYEDYELSTPVNKLFSEASLGKAHLEEMGIKPLQDFPNELQGITMSTYYGGRAEVHIRKTPTEVIYTDFLSMYPTVCTLMGLWRYVIADGISWHEATAETAAFLEKVDVSDVLNPDFWEDLSVIVQVEPDEEIFPVRAKYSNDSFTIGVNYLSSGLYAPWYTLADCVASKLLTGKSPKIIKAVKFIPNEPQKGLEDINILGDKKYRISPYRDDFFKRLVELRNSVKASRNNFDESSADYEKLDTEQHALKIIANSTSYGIYAQQNVKHYANVEEITCYGTSEDRPEFRSFQTAVEDDGPYFNPLIATFITGAARLMLATAERLAQDRGISWAFCDTDSMAFAKPNGMEREEFRSKVGEIVAEFKKLNPYECGGELLKLEKVNYVQPCDPKSLYALAISAKRYVLFNLGEEGKPIVRSAKQHGLGHIREPYGDDESPNRDWVPDPLEGLDIKRWQHDLWYAIIMAALRGEDAREWITKLKGFDGMAVRQVTITTPAQLGMFKRFNRGLGTWEKVRSSNFFNAYFSSPVHVSSYPEYAEWFDDFNISPVSPYEKDPKEALPYCFDRKSGKPVPTELLKTNREMVLGYADRKESKFDGDIGELQRKHIEIRDIVYIGKESAVIDIERHELDGFDVNIVYGNELNEGYAILQKLIELKKDFTYKEISEFSGVSAKQLRNIVSEGRKKLSRKNRIALQKSIPDMELIAGDRIIERERLINEANNVSKETGSKYLAEILDMDVKNLSKILSGKSRPSRKVLGRIRDGLEKLKRTPQLEA